MSIGPGHYAVLSALVFAIGVYGVVARRGVVSMLMSLNLMFLGPVVALLGFSEFGSGGQAPPAGAAFAAVAVVALALHTLAAGAILSLVHRRREKADVVEADELTA